MSVVGIAIVKDEHDVIEASVEHMLEEVDEVVVGDNLSTDGTTEILLRLAEKHVGRLTVFCDEEPAFVQSEKMTALAQVAAEAGAEWVVPFDADEWWMSPFGRVADVLADIPPQYLTASAALYDHVPTAQDPADGAPFDTIGWRRLAPAALPKVACRTRADLVILQGNHGATYEGETTNRDGLLVVRHFPYRSAAQFISKARNGAAAYAAAGDRVPADAGKHWRDYGALLQAHGEEALAGVFRQWFWEPFPEYRSDMIFDPVSGLASA